MVKLTVKAREIGWILEIDRSLKIQAFFPFFLRKRESQVKGSEFQWTVELKFCKSIQFFCQSQEK